MSDNTLAETWNPVVGYEALYEVSDLGRVRRGGRILKPGRHRFGYQMVNLCRDGVARSVTVHTLVLAAFVGPRPDGMEACHNDSDPSNSALSNLRWDTSAGNKRDMAARGTAYKNPAGSILHAKLRESDVLEVLRLGSEGLSQRKIAKRFGVTKGCVAFILGGQTWPKVQAQWASQRSR